MVLCIWFIFAVFLQSVFTFPTNIFNDESAMHPHNVNKREANSWKYYVDKHEETVDYWFNNAQKTIEEQLKKRPIEAKAKNVILFLGDGMSIPTLMATRAYQGQLLGQSGEGSKLSFDEFPYTGLSKTYCVDRQVADSACSATSYLCGVKANSGTIGVSPVVKRKDCVSMMNTTNHVNSIGRWSQLANKATGIITTTRVTHASPAGVYAHTADRNWESDSDVNHEGYNSNECADIASQLIYGETGSNFNVILGGGRAKFLPANYTDEENEKGERLDGRNLIEEWQQIKYADNKKAQYVWNKKQLLNVDDDTEYLLGLFDHGHCEFHLDANPETEPTLAEMTRAAIEVLSKNENGYFLFIEGGRIDHGHHATMAHIALDETLELSEAVRVATNMTNTEDTLIVVTSDHAHTMSVAGYADRGSDIFGIAGTSNVDNLPYSILSYANGLGYKKVDCNGNRHDISEDNMNDYNYNFPATVPLHTETHGGDDVGIFASGPWAHLLVGVIEQNVIPHILAYASCVGEGLTYCNS